MILVSGVSPSPFSLDFKTLDFGLGLDNSPRFSDRGGICLVSQKLISSHLVHKILLLGRFLMHSLDQHLIRERDPCFEACDVK